MKNILLLMVILSNYFVFGQLTWEETNTGSTCTISIGEFATWGMTDPTLNGEDLPDGALIGVFFLNSDDEYICGGAETWPGVGQGMIALSPWGDDSTTGDVQDGFVEGEAFNWFVRICDGTCWDDIDGDGLLDTGEVLEGTDYYAANAEMVPSNAMLTGTVYSTNAMAGLASADFVEYIEGEEETEELTCECEYGMAVPNGALCFIFNACSDPLANNYCPGLGSDNTTYYNEACTYDDAIEGCMCTEAVNYDAAASVDDGSCYVVDGGCSDPLADNYSGAECATATFLAENCEFAGCMCSDAYNYDATASVDDGSCWVLSGGCSDPEANNYSGDECASANFVAEDCQYTAVDVDLEWDYDITDGNMTIQIGADVVTFNGEAPPIGSLIGVFFTNDSGELQNAGYLEWTGDQLALAAWASESGYDNGFEVGEELTWGLSIGGEDFLATSSLMNTAAPFSENFVANGFGQLLSATFEGELTSILGCTDETAYNYNSDATVDDGSCYSLDFDYTITDGNMTIQVSQSAVTFNGIGEEPPCGSLLGGFYTNASGQLQCAGYQTWCDDFDNSQLAVPLFASESGEDNGFETGEEITWVLSVYGQSFVADYILMNPSPPFSETFIANGFGQLLVAEFNGEIDGVIGCTDENAENYNPDATIDDGSCSITGCTDELACNYDESAVTDDNSCYYELTWYYDEDGDGLGDDIYSVVACDPPGSDFADNPDDPCPYDAENDSNGNGICDSEEVLGCMNVNATNYDFYANVDDGSCIIPGCTDPNAFNYSDEATEDNDSCIDIVEGCLDASALNYSADANTNDDSCCYIPGCTDETALNYNDIACFDDDSCIAVVEGCTDPASFNYDLNANTDDGSCVPYVFGCLDLEACNYDSSANTDNGSCDYAQEYYDCNDVCLNDTDDDGVCDELEVLGCTDSNAFNYSDEATDDDGSCVNVVYGCIDSMALNFDITANTDDGNCCYIPGCTNSESFNYNSNACFDDDSCIAVVEGCTDPSAFNYNVNANTDDDSCCYNGGCTDPLAFNYDETACYDDASCIEVVEGCTDSSAFNYDSGANTDDGSCVDYVYGCLDLAACNYDSSVNTDNGSCVYAEDYYNCDGNCINDIDGDGTCDELEIGGCTNPIALTYNPDATEDDFCLFPGCLDDGACNYDPAGFYYELIDCEYESCAGCTDSNADNYNADATLDDGSCIISGCTDATACNYNELANNDDGSCYNNDLGCGCDNPAAEAGYDCDGNCLADADSDGVCDGDEVAGCTDASACNYDGSATDDDGSCYNNDLGCGCDTLAAEAGYDCDGNCLADADGDGVCDEFEVIGCTDSTGCNYDLSATDDDGSCEYAVEGYDCDGNELELDTPWGNNDGCDPFNTHTVAFTTDDLDIGDFVGLFYTDDNGDLVFAQAQEYTGSSFAFTVCGDDATTEEKDGFDVGESFIWQLWPVGEDCPYSIDLEYSDAQPSEGTYEVNGMSQVISISGSSLSVVISVTDALCNGDFGSAELTVTGGTAPYDIDDLSALLAGSYSTTVTDANGCSVVLDFEVTEPELLEASVSVTDALCNGDLGSAELTVTGGTAPYNMDDLSSLSAGSYTTIVTDANGCSVELNFQVTEPELLEASVSVTDALCNGDLGSAELTVTGGASPYNIDDLSSLLAGSYTTIVTDANGCSVELNFEVTEPELLEVSVLVTDALCNGDLGSAEFTITGGAAPYTFFSNTMDYEPTYFDVWENPLVLEEYAGSYSYGFSDSNGCLAFIEVTISEPELLEASVSVTDALCNGDLGSAELTVTGGTAPYDMDDLSSLSAGSYTTIVTDANGCSVALDFEVIEPELLEVSINTEDVSCNGLSDGSATIGVSGGSGEYDYEVQLELESQQNNYSLLFDGVDDYVDCGNNSSYNLGYDDFTIQAWVFNQDTNANCRVFARGNTNTPGGYQMNVAPNGRLRISIDNMDWFSDVGVIQENVWHHLALTRNDGVIEAFVDGEIMISFDISVNLDCSDDLDGNGVVDCFDDQNGNGVADGVMHIGNDPGFEWDSSFPGYIDNVSLWNIGFSQDEIQDFINCPSNGTENNLIGYWNFDEGSGEVAYDMSIYSNDADINGPVYSNIVQSINCSSLQSISLDNLDNLSAGDYVITTTDSNGCSDVIEFSISEPEELSINLESTPGEYSNCISGTASVFVEGGTPAYEYLWSNGATASEITGLCGGDYSVIVTDANGCTIEGNVTVEYLIPDGWDVLETDLIHTIDIPSSAIMILDQIDLVDGDYIGVFFDNDDGTQTCGGYVMFQGESNLQLIAYGNDGINDGFEQGEQFNWVVWNSEAETEAFGFAVYDDSYPDERYFNAGGQSGLLGSVFANYQIIPLNESPYSDWDMISTYMDASETVQSIFAPVSEELIIIKDANGLVYWPAWSISTLISMDFKDAYAVKTWAPNDILVYGDFMQPESILFELSGWNYISYPRYFPEDVEVALADIQGNIKLLKDDEGNIYWPELGLNTMNQMEAGEGYILKVMNDQLFNYPSNSDNVVAVDGPTTAGRLGFDHPVYYSDVDKTNSNMVIGLPFDAWHDFEVQYGDELAVFDSEGNMVGVSVLKDDNNMVVVWEDDNSDVEKNGMLEGEEFSIELWDQSLDKIYSLEMDWIEGTDYFNTNGINIASVINVEEKVNNNLISVSCYPNPSLGDISLEFNLNSDDYINVSIFNVIGEKVYSLDNDLFRAGLNVIPISLSHLGQGLYYIEVQSTEESKSIIIDLTK